MPICMETKTSSPLLALFPHDSMPVTDCTVCQSFHVFSVEQSFVGCSGSMALSIFTRGSQNCTKSEQKTNSEVDFDWLFLSHCSKTMHASFPHSACVPLVSHQYLASDGILISLFFAFFSQITNTKPKLTHEQIFCKTGQTKKASNQTILSSTTFGMQFWICLQIFEHISCAFNLPDESLTNSSFLCHVTLIVKHMAGCESSLWPKKQRKSQINGNQRSATWKHVFPLPYFSMDSTVFKLIPLFTGSKIEAMESTMGSFSLSEGTMGELVQSSKQTSFGSKQLHWRVQCKKVMPTLILAPNEV